MHPTPLPRFIFFFLAALLLDTAAAQGTGAGPAALGGPAGVHGALAALRTAQPIVLTGDVRTASGEAPPELVAIKLLCGMESSTEAYTRSDGGFSFEVGDRNRFAVMDASAGSVSRGAALGTAAVLGSQPNRTGAGLNLSSCRLTAEAPGYVSSQIALSFRSGFDRPTVGTLILTPTDGSHAALVSATSLAAPKAAKDAYEKATKELSKGRSANLSKVLARLEKALSEYPAYAAAWTLLGETRLRTGDRDRAADAFNRAIQADPGYLRPYEPLATIRAQQRNWGQAAELTRIALDLDPGNVVLHWLHAVSEFELGNNQEALSCLDHVESDDAGAEKYPQTHHVRGLIFSERGDFVEAAEELQLFLKATPDSPAADAVRKRLHEWRELGVV